jgi:hypothetical protein
MTTIKFNSKGQRIEELDFQPYPPLEKVEPNINPPSENIRGSFQSPKPVSPKRFPPPLLKKVEQNEEDLAPPPLLKKVEQNKQHLAPPFLKVEEEDLAPPPLLKKEEQNEEEILAWSEYYLNNKKKETKLNHIYFSSFNKSGGK